MNKVKTKRGDSPEPYFTIIDAAESKSGRFGPRANGLLFAPGADSWHKIWSNCHPSVVLLADHHLVWLEPFHAVRSRLAKECP